MKKFLDAAKKFIPAVVAGALLLGAVWGVLGAALLV